MCIFSILIYSPPKVCTRSLILNFKMQKFPGLGGGHPLPHPPPPYFPRFLDRRVMCLILPLDWRAKHIKIKWYLTRLAPTPIPYKIKFSLNEFSLKYILPPSPVENSWLRQWIMVQGEYRGKINTIQEEGEFFPYRVMQNLCKTDKK